MNKLKLRGAHDAFGSTPTIGFNVEEEAIDMENPIDVREPKKIETNNFQGEGIDCPSMKWR